MAALIAVTIPTSAHAQQAQGVTTMLCITLTAAGLVAAGAAFAQEAPEGNRVEINGMQMYYEVSGGGDRMIDYGFMYGHGFQDLDGHVWEVFYMDPSHIKQG
jgi:predicted lactoylglutathione lyase